LRLHLFDGNQGNIEAALAEQEDVRQELTRTELSLRKCSADVTDEYRNVLLIASRLG